MKAVGISPAGAQVGQRSRTPAMSDGPFQRTSGCRPSTKSDGGNAGLNNRRKQERARNMPILATAGLAVNTAAETADRTDSRELPRNCRDAGCSAGLGRL